MRTRLRVLGVASATAVAAVAIPLVTSSSAHAARFTGGNVVVYQVGDGTTGLTNAAAPVFLDEYTPGGSEVQSIALPTAAAEGNHILTAAGESRSEGLIDRSADGRFIALTGYDAQPGTTAAGGISLAATDPTKVPRVLGLVDANGTVDTTTELSGAKTAQIIRSAATTNGERLWATGGNGGIVTTTRGSATSSLVAGTDDSNLNALTIQGNQLFSSGILANRLSSVGTGTPTSGSSLTDLSGLPDNLLTYGYALVDETSAGYGSTTLDTLYIADGSSRGGTIDKYRWDGTTWQFGGDVDVPGAFGVVADKSGSSVSLAVTTPTQLITLSDQTGSAASFDPTTPSTVATAATDTEFRGVALAPSAPAGPSVYLRTPAAGASVVSGTTVPVKAYVDSPVGVASVQAKIGSGAYVTATKSGHLWTANIPTSGLSAGNATVTVQATDNAATPATSTATRTVAITGSSAPKGALTKGTYAWTVKQVKTTGSWKTYKTKSSPSGKGETSSKKNSKATATVYGSGLTLTFDRSAKAGKVKVTVDGKSTTLSLFNKPGKPVSKSWTFKGAVKSHTVTVTVLGTKASGSKGVAALLAALKVKA